MPELSNDMYCSQQIVVPPMFPYLLRQYAKAAIRSQPSDLLRWSTAYFRCLSLNLPPPVKPRLEYPIPKDYEGITLGWMKALLYQFQGSSHVDFKRLWDRWMGACLNRPSLIKILCLGGFTDPMAVPFLRFIALCVAFVCSNLTETMIMICEELTEEPEGGSAMIAVELFVDLYEFLAAIDASKTQTLINHYFTDDLLDLLEKEQQKAEETAELEAEPQRLPSATSVNVEEEEALIAVDKDAISCPDLKEVATNSSDKSDTADDDADAVGFNALDMQPQQEENQQEETGLQEAMEQQENVVASDEIHPVEVPDLMPSYESMEGEGEMEFEPPPPPEQAALVIEESAEVEPAVDSIEQIPEALPPGVIEQYLEQIAAGADETEAGGVEQPEPLLFVEQEAKPVSMDLTSALEAPVVETFVSEEEEEESVHATPKVEEEEIEVEPIPGIGGVVPVELVEAVVAYMKKVAATQHGMVMPRNIRHYSCPPLEVID